MAHMKIAFFATYDPTLTHILAPEGLNMEFLEQNLNFQICFISNSLRFSEDTDATKKKKSQELKHLLTRCKKHWKAYI